MSLTSVQFQGYLGQLLNGIVITCELFCSAFILVLVFGVTIGIITLSRNRIIQGVWWVYASIIMGVPSLLVIFLIYYGGSAMLSAVLGKSRQFDVTPFGAGLASLTIVYAAYVAELVHGAVRNLPRQALRTAGQAGAEPRHDDRDAVPVIRHAAPARVRAPRSPRRRWGDRSRAPCLRLSQRPRIG